MSQSILSKWDKDKIIPYTIIYIFMASQQIIDVILANIFHKI